MKREQKYIQFEGKLYPDNQFIIEKNKLYGRVSAVLSPFVNFHGIPEEVLERKATLGTLVHQKIKEAIDGYLPVTSIEERGYVHSFYQWRDALSPVFVESEMRYYCGERMVTGCIDALIKLHGEEKTVLIDFKTSVCESPTVWTKQAHLYNYLLSQSGKEPAPRFLFIKLDKSGKLPKVFEYKFDSTVNRECFQAIDAFWEIWRS